MGWPSHNRIKELIKLAEKQVAAEERTIKEEINDFLRVIKEFDRLREILEKFKEEIFNFSTLFQELGC